MFTTLSNIINTAGNDPRLNGFGDLPPRSPNAWDPNDGYSLGSELTGQALTDAQTYEASFRARVTWLGNEQLATKYGNVDPSTVSLTDIESEIWSRTKGAVNAITTAILAAQPSLMFVEGNEQMLRGHAKGPTKTSAGGEGQQKVIEDKKPVPPPSRGGIGDAPNPRLAGLVDLLKNLSGEDRGAIIASLTK